MGTGVMLGVTLRWTSIPSRGEYNTPGRFMLRKSEMSAGLMGLLARKQGLYIEFQETLKMLFTVWKYLHWVLVIFKFEKCVKYANELTDDIIHSIQYKIKCKNRAILVNLPQRALKHGRLIVIQATHLWL